MKNHLKSVLFLLFISIAASSCFSVKHSSTKSAKKYYETFFVGEDGTQYFIKPIPFKAGNTDGLLVDFTFRYKDEIKDSVVVNFTITSNEVIKKLDGVLFNGIPASEIKLLFNKKEKDKFLSRFTAEISLESLNSMFNAADIIIEVQGNYQGKFTPTSKTWKTIKSLRDNLFVLF